MNTSPALRARPLLVFFCLVAAATTVGCSDDATAGVSADASTDGKTNPPSGDAGTNGDGATTDAALPPSDSGSQSATCSQASECRAYSSTCGTCSCIPLRKDEIDPVCKETPASCIVDPCQNKTVGCVDGFCVIQP